MSRLNQFPLLRAQIPSSLREVAKLKNGTPSDRFLYYEMIKIIHLWRRMKNLPESEIRKLWAQQTLSAHSYFQKENEDALLEKSMQTLETSLEDADELITKLIRLSPQSVRNLLDSDSIAGTQDIKSLMMIAFGRTNSDLEKMRQFEARRKLIFTLLFWEIRSHEKVNPVALNGGKERLEKYIEQTLFDGKIEKIQLHSLHNPDTMMPVAVAREFDFNDPALDKSLIIKEYSNWCRFIKVGNRFIPLIFFSDRKDIFSLVLKMIIKNERRPSHIGDLLRMKFIFINQEDKKLGMHRLCRLTFLPGSTHEFKIKEEGGNNDNEFSSPFYNLTKLNFFFEGWSCEMMAMDTTTFIGEMHAHNGVNHSIYKAMQYLRHIYPRAFPRKIYGIDWSEERIREEMIQNFKNNNGL